MGLIYTCPFDNISVTNDADQDVLEWVNSSSITARLLEIQIWSALATFEALRLRLVRRTTTGSGGSAATEKALSGINTVAAAVAVSTLVTTPGTLGDILESYYWGQLAPLIILPTPECQIEIAGGGRLGLHLETAVGGTRSWSGFSKWEER